MELVKFPAVSIVSPMTVLVMNKTKKIAAMTVVITSSPVGFRYFFRFHDQKLHIFFLVNDIANKKTKTAKHYLLHRKF